MEFAIYGVHGDGLVRVLLEEVFEDVAHWAGGLDVRCSIETKCGGYIAKGEVWLSTAEVLRFYEALNECYATLKGEARFSNYEHNLDFKLIFDGRGHYVVYGSYQEYLHNRTALHFEFDGDQTCLTDTLKQLKKIEVRYGRLER